MQSKVGKKTPVWRNKKDGRAICGGTVQDALGVGCHYDVGTDWERVTALPVEDRVVIHDGTVLPKNLVTIAIAENAHGTGPLSIVAMRREFSYTVLYVDSVRVIISTGTSTAYADSAAQRGAKNEELQK